MSSGRQRRKEKRAAERARTNKQKMAVEKPILIPSTTSSDAETIEKKNQDVDNPTPNSTPKCNDPKPTWKQIILKILGVGTLISFTIGILCVTANGFFNFFSDQPAIQLLPFSLALCLVVFFGAHKMVVEYEKSQGLYAIASAICLFIVFGSFQAIHVKASSILAESVARSREHQILTNLPSASANILSNLDELKKITAANLKSFSDSTNLYNKRYPGCGMHIIVRLDNPVIGRNHFILDMGHVESNRFSLFLDSEQNLCFRVIDRDANAIMVKAKPGFGTFLFNNEMYVLCEYGSTADFSFIRVAVNGKQVAEKHQNAPMIMSDGFTTNSPKVFGADLEHQNHARLWLIAWMQLNATMDSPEGVANFFDALEPTANSINAQEIPEPDYIQGTQFTHKQLEDFFPVGYAVMWLSENKSLTYKVFKTGLMEWKIDFDQVTIIPNVAAGNVTWVIPAFSIEMPNGKEFAQDVSMAFYSSFKNGAANRAPFTVIEQPSVYGITLSADQKRPVFAIGFRITTKEELDGHKIVVP